MGDFGHAMLENYEKLKTEHADLKRLYEDAQKRIAELEAAAGKDKPEPPPK
jgi:molybdenum-dependent DNA-binding transcriptional regulator ModE